MKRLFTNFFLPRTRAGGKGHTDEEHKSIEALYHYLKSILIPLDPGTELRGLAKKFRAASKEKKQDLLPRFYLEVENFLFKEPTFKGTTKSDFRKKVATTYPALTTVPSFALILLENEIQKVSLCQFFLADVLAKAKELLGKFKDPFLVRAEQKLLRSISDSVSISQHRPLLPLKELYAHSQVLQKKLKDSLGENAVLNLYNSVYNSYFERYYLLDVFLTVVNLVPEELLIHENKNLPSKGQLHRLLTNQISNLENLNKRLSAEIVERKAAQKKLEKNERLYTAILHNSADAKIIFKKKGSILKYNSVAMEEFPALGGEGKLNLFDLLPEELSKELKIALKKFSDDQWNDIPDLYKFQITSPSAIKYLTLKITSFNLDEKLLFFAVISDVTQEKKSTMALQEAMQIAKKSAKAKSVFLSNISHELRTPLNIINGLTELLAEQSSQNSKTTQENLGAIRFATENMIMLVDDILDFSKIEAGKLRIQQVDFNFKGAIEHLEKGIQLKAKEKGLKFSVQMSPDVPHFIVGDQFRLSQVLNNLLSNALKFTEKGEVSLHVDAQPKAPGKVALTFTVSDTGIGIEQDQFPYIFNSFYQINNSNSKPIGAGLGLSITQQLVQLMGGSLEVDSFPGEGTHFYFSLDYALSELGNRVAAPKQTDEIQYPLENKNILVAEDNRLNQMLIKQLLKQWNANVTIAVDGTEVMKKVHERHFDLILMDLHMPKMDGIEATRRIRRHSDQRIKNTPIVACTADVFPESRQKAELAGVNFYLTKPINKKSINEILFLFTKNA